MASLKCKDIGMNCGFEIIDPDENELLKIIALHADNTHGIKEVSPELLGKIKKAIKK